MLLSPRSFRPKVSGSFYPPSSSGVGHLSGMGFFLITFGVGEPHHVSPRPLVRLDERADEDVCRFEQTTTQRTGGVVLRYGPGALLFPGQRRFLHGRLAGTARTLRPQPFARVVVA